MNVKFCTVTLFTFLWLSGFATIRRVGYTATIQPITNVDYVNFQAAHDAASNGDTIQLYPSTSNNTTYTGTISKPVVIIGSGYYNNSYYLSGSEIANQNLQNLPGIINSCSFTVDVGSSGVVFQSLNNISVTTANTVGAIGGVKIMRCKDVNVVFDNYGVCNAWIIAQCYGVTITQTNASGSFSGNRTITNLQVNNSVMGNVLLSTSPTGTYSGNKIYNCIFPSVSLSLSNAQFTIQNSIFNGQTFTAVTNVAFIKNLTTSAQTGNPMNTNAGSSGNLYSQNMSNVFVGYPTNPVVGGVNTYSNDAKYQLKAGSPAINAGFVPPANTVATDCGIFGNGTANAYVLSGMPAMPVFTRLNAPSAMVVTGSTYTITFSVTSNN